MPVRVLSVQEPVQELVSVPVQELALPVQELGLEPGFAVAAVFPA